MKYTVVAPVGEKLDTLFITVREFPTEKIILICPKDQVGDADKAERELQRFRIPVETVVINGDPWEEMFRVISQISRSEKNILVNVGTGDSNMQCAATSAAFVNGVKAMTVEGDQSMLLPVLKFNYYKLISEKKMAILKTLYTERDCCASLEQLSRKIKMSLPLVSYHINGTPKTEGLKAMGLIEAEEAKGRVLVKLTPMGNLLIKGYVN
ncbi:MAG: winged helix-turn-helix transcriptional regulator [Candidatus Aenigmarchaeota archaeon]|nr:winged helix-turn-helix transcriptional regulator [Candidatus Aenigmarchaeota archaeon]